MRFRQWLLTIGDRDEDLVVNCLTPANLDFAFGGKRGFAARIRTTGIEGQSMGDDGDIAAALTSTFAGICLPRRQLKICLLNRGKERNRICDVRPHDRVRRPGEILTIPERQSDKHYGRGRGSLSIQLYEYALSPSRISGQRAS